MLTACDHPFQPTILIYKMPLLEVVDFRLVDLDEKDSMSDLMEFIDVFMPNLRSFCVDWKGFDVRMATQLLGLVKDNPRLEKIVLSSFYFNSRGILPHPLTLLGWCAYWKEPCDEIIDHVLNAATFEVAMLRPTSNAFPKADLSPITIAERRANRNVFKKLVSRQ
jgi:hypothetical protein